MLVLKYVDRMDRMIDFGRGDCFVLSCLVVRERGLAWAGIEI